LGGSPDWYTVDRGAIDATMGTGQPGEPIDVQPVPVADPGMPRPRFWELEDGHVNLDAAPITDPAHMVLVSFAHRYANDWYRVPLRVAPGACVITSLPVTDTFGTTEDVPAAAAVDGGSGPWRFWGLTPRSDPTAAAGVLLLLPPATAPIDGPVL